MPSRALQRPLRYASFVSFDSGPNAVRPPVALGCFFAAAVVVVAVLVVAFGIVFLESGADTGKLELQPAEAYAPGYVEYIGDENVFIVRLLNGEFLALSDLDAANRAAQSRRCRVALTAINDPAIGIPIATLQGRISAGATGSSSVFREACLGAVYDLTGARLTGDGRNLDRHPVSIDSSGRLVVDVSERECSVRSGTSTSEAVAC